MLEVHIQKAWLYQQFEDIERFVSDTARKALELVPESLVVQFHLCSSES